VSLAVAPERIGAGGHVTPLLELAGHGETQIEQEGLRVWAPDDKTLQSGYYGRPYVEGRGSSLGNIFFGFYTAKMIL